MTRKYFGTDGIRGRANEGAMTPDMVMKAAMATACVLKREENTKGHKNRVLIGKDTRLSGYMLEPALAAGFVAMGMDVVMAGPIPTPGVAMLTRSMRADVGIMISASHNPYEDNGIKLFGPDGYKLPDETELEIEQWMDNPALFDRLVEPSKLGRASRMEDASGRYVEYIKRSIPKGKTLEGLKVVVDCAHGAAYKVAPQVLWELEADVISIGVSPNGRNINAGFGATATENLQKTVLEEQADIGIALDGDSDRLIVVDEKGAVVDGDQLMALLAISMKQEHMLHGDAVVATVMSNLGLERFLEENKIKLIRTPVGDRYVVEQMREADFSLGGEQSGHIILPAYNTTGDGLVAALQVLYHLKEQNNSASEVLHLFDPFPQVLKNVRYTAGRPLENETVLSAIKKAEATLANDGRIFVRPSGTEPVIRVMAEGKDLSLIETLVDDVCQLIKKV